MRQAANRQPQPRPDGSTDLLRRLLARRTSDGRSAAVEAFADEAPSPQDAAILVLKAALRAERAEVSALQARLAALHQGER